MKNWLITCITTLFFLVSCATMTPEQQSYLTQQAMQPIYCYGGDECEIKWGMALRWILNNSYWKIRTQSDSLIATEGPLDTVYAAYQIQKVPLGSNKYEIVMSLGCGNPFGCVPSLLELKASFVNYVNSYQAPAAPESVAEVSPEPSPIPDITAEAQASTNNPFYLKAEDYYQKGQYGDAIFAFQQFINSSPTDARVPDAMLKQSYSLIKINKKEEAKTFLQSLIDKYPQSEEAILAQTKLSELNAEK